jgi:hypothetical protein
MAKKSARPANTRALKKYKDTKQHEKNKIRKISKHLKDHPEDNQSLKVVEDIKKNGAPWKRKNPIKRKSHKEKIYEQLLAVANKPNKYPEVGIPEWKQILETVKTKPSIRFLRNARKRTMKVAQ